MTDFFNSIFGWLGDLLTSLWQLIQKALPYILLALALFLAFSTAGLTIPLLGIVIPSGWLSAAIVAGVSFLLAPGETAAMVNVAVDAIGDAVGNVVTEAAGIVGEGVSTFASASGISNLLLYAAIGVGLYFLLTSDKDEEEKQSRRSQLDPVGTDAS